jgi:hypothetical protein
MAQPYLPTFSGKRYSVGPEAIKGRPAFTSAIGKCISMWSYVDNELGGLFGILLGADSEAAHRVFLILRRWSHQREALEAAAEGRLSNDEMTVYRSLIVDYERSKPNVTILGMAALGCVRMTKTYCLLSVSSTTSSGRRTFSRSI